MSAMFISIIKKTWLIGGLVFIIGCTHYRPDKYCDFPVHGIDDIKITAELAPEPLFLDINLVSLTIIDTFMLSYLGKGSSFVSVSSLNTGEEIGEFCLKGKGPDENVMLMPYFQPDNSPDSVFIFDATRSFLRIWDLNSSVAEHRDVYSGGIKLDNGKGTYMSSMSMYKLDDKRVLTYDASHGRSLDLARVPRYWVFDYGTGELLDSIKCFRDIPLKSKSATYLPNSFVMSHYSCLDSRHETLYMAMYYLPLFSILNIQNGKAKGFAIKDLPEQNDQDPIIYFTSISESEGFVYCLYFGDKQSSFLSLNASESEPLDVKSTLFVFNNEGKLCAKYKLDDVYERCQVSNGKLYLTNISHERSGLYVLPVTELINSSN